MFTLLRLITSPSKIVTIVLIFIVVAEAKPEVLPGEALNKYKDLKSQAISFAKDRLGKYANDPQIRAILNKVQ